MLASERTPESSGVAARVPARGGLALALGAALASCASPADGKPGTALVFVLEAPFTDPVHFYDAPFPSDLRTVGGHADYRGFPYPPGNPLLENVLTIAGDTVGFAGNANAYFRFDGPLGARTEGPFTDADDPVLLVDLDADAATSLVPSVASVLESDAYAPENLLAVAPVPGFVFAPRHRIAAVVLRAFGDASGAPLGVPVELGRLAHGRRPTTPEGQAAATLFADAFARVRALGVDPSEVAALTVFTVSDVAADTRALTDAVRAREQPVLEGLAFDATDGLTHARYCELHGTIDLPQLQVGTPPYDTEGLFEVVAGVPVTQRRERAPVVVTVPRSAMPAAGFPVVLYAHGTDGLSTQVVDRGPTTVAGGTPAVGEGPAHVFAFRGIATVSLATLLGPERNPVARTRAYLNFGNLAAYRDTFRQGILELRLLLDALATLRIPAADLAACSGLDLAGASEARFDLGHLGFMGQSAGAQLVTLTTPVDDRGSVIVASGSGGHWPLLLSEGTRVGGPPELFALIAGTQATLTPHHPALDLIENAWQSAEPLLYAPYVIERPLAGVPRRQLFLPTGQDDGYFPEPVYDAMAVAYGAERVGTAVWTSMDDSLALAGLRVGLTTPVVGNRTLAAGAFTVAVEQWPGDGIVDSHNIVFQYPGLKHQVACFFRTGFDRGQATLVVPATEDAPCP